MTDAIRPLIAGNWKMNGLKSSLAEFEAMLAGASDVADKADLLVCPPATLIADFAQRAHSRTLSVGAQDCHAKPSGAHTGDLSAEMLADAGARAIIVGHSERRADHGETDVEVRQKAEAVWRAGLTAIVCIGETQHQRDQGQTLDICRGQLNISLPDGSRADNLVVAYEPVWAIGTGRTASGADAAAMADAIRATLRSSGWGLRADAVPVLYGGSCTSATIGEFLAEPGIDGALVGGASLKPDEMAGMVARAALTAAARRAAS